MRWNRVLLLVTAGLGLLALASGCGESQPEAGTPAERVAAPDLSLGFLDGKTARLSDYRGRVVVLNFWATWCPPCRAEIPDLAALHREYRDRGVMVVGISLDEGGSDAVEAFAARHEIPYPITIQDPREMHQIWSALPAVPTIRMGGSDRPRVESGGIEAIPTTFILDREGRIYRKHVGYRDRAHIEAELQSLIAKGG